MVRPRAAGLSPGQRLLGEEQPPCRAFETTLRPQGDGFVVDGDKFYATGALFAHFIHIGAVDAEGRVHLAIVDRDARA